MGSRREQVALLPSAPRAFAPISVDSKNRLNFHPERSEGSAVRFRAVVGVNDSSLNRAT
jgi:hypothetical protein